MGIRELFLRLSERLDACDAAHNYTCDLCGREVFENERICKACRAELPKIERCCPFCGRRVREEGVCLECKKQPLTVEKARSCYLHEDGAAALVLRFKRGERYLVHALCRRSCAPSGARISRLRRPHLRSHDKRGRSAPAGTTNPSCSPRSSPAARAGSFWTLPKSARRPRRRKRWAAPHARPTLKGAFHLIHRKEVKGRRILIVDDTMTTGATAGELASLFYRAGAGWVGLITFTSVEDRTLHPKDSPKARRKA